MRRPGAPTAGALCAVAAGGPFPALRRLQIRLWRPADEDYLQLLRGLDGVVRACPALEHLSADFSEFGDVHMCELLTVLRHRPFRSLMLRFASCTVAGLALLVCGVVDVGHLSVTVRDPVSVLTLMPMLQNGGWPHMPQSLDIHLSRADPRRERRSNWSHPTLCFSVHVH